MEYKLSHNRNFVERGGCPLCSSTRYSVFIDFRQIPIYKCDECLFLYSGRVLAEAKLAAYYKKDFGSLRHMRGQQVNAKVNLLALSKLLNISQIKSLLDVGTGYGFLIKELRDRHQLEVKGVELSEQEARYAVEELGINVANCPLAETGFATESFDAVTCFEVIEHVPDPKAFIAELAQYVKPGGHLLVMTDNFNSKVCRSLGAAFPKWIPHAHISHFTPQTLAQCLTSTKGLQLERCLSYTPWELVARAQAMRLRQPPAPAECFDLDQTLDSEMNGYYRFFRMRRALNRLWFNATFKNNLDGALMFAVARKMG